MFGTFRRHQNWIMLAVAAVVIVTFIAYFNPASKSGNRNRGSSGGYNGMINGRPIADDELEDAIREVALGYLLDRQRVDQTSVQTRFEAIKMLFLAKKEEELGINVGPEAAAAYADRYILRGQLKRDQVLTQLLQPAGFTEDDFARFLRHQAGLRQLVALEGLAGSMTTPAEAEIIYVSESRELASSLVFFPYSNYLSKVSYSNTDLVQYFNSSMSNYAIPEKMVVNYVKFNVTNYLADAKNTLTNLEDLVTRMSDEAGTNLPPGTKTPEEAKAKYREELLRSAALQMAAQKANDFAMHVDSKRQEAGTNALEAEAKSEGLTVETTPPFDQSGPKGMNVPPGFVMTAFHLDPQQAPFSGRIPAEDGAYVIGFKERIPLKIPTLDEVKDKVTADFKEEKAREQAL